MKNLIQEENQMAALTVLVGFIILAPIMAVIADYVLPHFLKGDSNV